MNTQSLTDSYTTTVNSSNTKHLMLNYSHSEVGLRHPEVPAGIVMRDQFQVDLYAGSSKFLLDGNADLIYGKSNTWSLNAKQFRISVSDITKFDINNKYFNPDLFWTDQVLSFSDSSALDYQLLSSGAYVLNPDGTTSQIVGLTPMSQIFDAACIWKDVPESVTPSADLEIWKLMQTTMQGII